MKHMYLVVVAVVAISFKQASGAVDPTFNEQYDKKVCRNEPTCNLTLTPDLDPTRLTLEGRDCMCDFECPEYNDCCKDSQYFKASALSKDRKIYSCHPTFRIYTVLGCPAGYTGAEYVKQKCNKAFQKELDEDDTIIITPVTNKNKRITYANGWCALCHGDSDYDVWNLTAGCGEPVISNGKTRVNFAKYKNKIDSIVPLAHYNPTKKQFTATFEGKEVVCDFAAKMPATLASYTRPCLPDMVAKCEAQPDGTQKCQSHIAIVYDITDKKPYRNRECAICNGVPSDKLSGCPVGVRTGAGILFSSNSKAAGSNGCSDPAVKEKFNLQGCS